MEIPILNLGLTNFKYSKPILVCDCWGLPAPFMLFRGLRSHVSLILRFERASSIELWQVQFEHFQIELQR